MKGDKTSSEVIEVINFFEEVGLLVRRGYLDSVDTWEMFSDTVFPLYVGTKEFIEQDQLEDANSFTNFVALYKLLSNIEERKNGKAHLQSDVDITDFWRPEQYPAIGWVG